MVSELLVNHDKVAITDEDSHSVIKGIAAVTFAGTCLTLGLVYMRLNSTNHTAGSDTVTASIPST